MKHPPLLDPSGKQYEVEYPHDVTFLMLESPVHTMAQVRELSAKAKYRLVVWIFEAYGYSLDDIGDLDPEDIEFVIMGEVQIDHCGFFYKESIEKGCTRGTEIMSALQASQTARVSKVIGKSVAGPSETKEAPAPRAEKKGNGKSGAKPVPPTTKRPAKVSETETKAARNTSGKANMKNTSAKTNTKATKPVAGKGGAKVAAKPAAAKKVAKREAVATSTRGRKASVPVAPARGRKAAPAPVARGRKASAAPVESHTGKTHVTGSREPKNKKAIEYIRTRIIAGDKDAKIVTNVERMFAGTVCGNNPMGNIYRQRSMMYKEGVLVRPEGSRGRPGAYEVPKKSRKRK